MSAESYFLSAGNPVATIDQRELEAVAIRLLSYYCNDAGRRAQIAGRESGFKRRFIDS